MKQDRTHHCWLLVAVVVVMALSPVAACAQNSAEFRALDRLRQTYLTAYATGDSVAMKDVYLPHATRMPYDAPVQGSRDAIMAYYRHSFATRRFSPDLQFTVDDLMVRGDLAIERGHYREELVPLGGGPTLLELGKYLVVARKGMDGHWRYESTIFNRDGAPTPLSAASPEYRKWGASSRCLGSATGLRIDVLVDAASLGDREVEVARITFPARAGRGGGHQHGSIEILYVLDGRLEHVVNGESHVLEPGMAGVVHPGDEVIHRALGGSPVEALVVWAPGGELSRIKPLLDDCSDVS